MIDESMKLNLNICFILSSLIKKVDIKTIQMDTIKEIVNSIKINSLKKNLNNLHASYLCFFNYSNIKKI